MIFFLLIKQAVLDKVLIYDTSSLSNDGEDTWNSNWISPNNGLQLPFIFLNLKKEDLGSIMPINGMWQVHVSMEGFKIITWNCHVEAYGHVMARIKDLSKNHARGPSSGCQHIPVCLLAFKSSQKDSSEGEKKDSSIGWGDIRRWGRERRLYHVMPPVNTEHIVQSQCLPLSGTLTLFLGQIAQSEISTFYFVLTSSVRIGCWLWWQGYQVPGVWKHHSFSLPLPSFSVVWVFGKLQDIPDYHRRAKKFCLGTKMEGPRMEDCQGACIPKYGANMRHGFEFVCFRPS